MTLAHIEPATPAVVTNSPGIALSTFEEVIRFADFAARTGMVPASMKGKPDEVALAIVAGLEMGMPPVEAFKSFDIIQGRAALKPEAMRKLVLRRGHVMEPVEWTTEAVTLRVQRAGREEHLVTYTIVDAQRAHLTTKDNWKNYPAEMLMARCTSKACRAFFADIISGFSTPDEIEGSVIEAPKPAAALPATPTFTEAEVEGMRAKAAAEHGFTDDEWRRLLDEVGVDDLVGQPKTLTPAIVAARDAIKAGRNQAAAERHADPDTGEVARAAKTGDALHAELAARGFDEPVRRALIVGCSNGATSSAKGLDDGAALRVQQQAALLEGDRAEQVRYVEQVADQLASSKEKGAAALVKQMTEWLTAQHAEGAEA